MAEIQRQYFFGQVVTPEQAEDYPIPHEFEGECTGFPERILSFGGWVPIGHHCRQHDWHYTILRNMRGIWTLDEWNAFRKWADLLLFLSIVKDLKDKFYFTWLAVKLAQAVYFTVRSKLGELAALGRL